MSTVDEESVAPPPPCDLCDGTGQVLQTFNKDGSRVMTDCPKCKVPTTPEGRE